METSGRLYFDCTYSKGFLKALMDWLGLKTHRKSVFLTLQWIRRNCRIVFRRKVFYAAIAGGVYQIWRARNSSLWEHTIPTVTSLLQTLQYDIKHRALSISGKKLSDLDREWLLAL